MNWKAINGKEVVDSDGYTVGKIDDLDVDIVNGTVDHLIMKSGFNTKHVITLDKIMSIGDKVLLKVRKGDLSTK